MSKKAPHIIFLARWYPHKYDPMFGLFVKRHAEAAALYGDVSVIYVHADDNANESYDVEQCSENNVNTIRVYYKKSNNKIISLLRFFRANRLALRRIQKPDLIHVHVMTRLGVIALLRRMTQGTPYIITEHWSRYLPGNDFSGLIRKSASKIVVRHASLVTTVTDNLAKAMKNHGLYNSRYTILPNVVDVNIFKPIDKDNTIPKIIHISCFEDKSKNITGLLEALVWVKHRGYNFHCTLIGDGMDFESMKIRAHTLGLEQEVDFTGLLEGERLAQELASGDFLVLSSNYENMPVVILEALSSGLPVVSTQVGGIAEIINDKNGILVAPHDVDALTEGIINMLTKYRQYDSKLLRTSITERYSTENVGKLLWSWYLDALNRR